MADDPKKKHGFSILAGLGSSGRILIVSLAVVVLIIGLVRGYLFLDFRDHVKTTLTGLEVSSLRASYLLTAYQLTLESYNLAQQAAAQPTKRAILRPLYIQKVDSIRATRDTYLSLLQRSPRKEDEIELAAGHFFRSITGFLSRTDGVFDAKISASGKLELSGEATTLFQTSVNNDFRNLRRHWQLLTRLELQRNIREFSDQKVVIATRTEEWFVVTTVLFVITIGCTIAVIILAGRTTSLARQLRVLFERSVNPIEVADPAGKIVYVNTEFERWKGQQKSDLVGTSVFGGLRVVEGAEREQPAWEAVQSSIQSGESWTGEVEFEERPGTYSVLFVFPVFDRNGRLWRIMGVHRDISEKKKLVRAVEETREQYHKLIESSRDGMVVVRDSKIVFVNPAAVRIFQYASEEEMYKLDFVDLIAPPSRPFLRLDYDHRSSDEEILRNYEMKGLTKGGKLVDLELDVRAIVWNDTRAMHASFRDISSRKALERQQAVWLWEQETLSSIDRQLLGIVDMQKVLDIILQQVMLLTRSQVVAVAIIDPEDRQGYWRVAKGNRSSLVGQPFTPTHEMIAMLRSGESLAVEDCRSDGRVAMSDWPALQAEEIVSVAFFPLIVNTKPGGMLTVGFRQPHAFAEREIRVLASMAEKVSIALSSGQLYEHLLRREKELELLSGARVQAQEEERRRISREIHDGLGQLLTAIKLNLEILEDNLPAGEEAGKRIVEAKQLLDNVLKEAREISYNLMPSVLDDFGLGPGLQSLCEQFSKRTGLRVSFHEHGLTNRLSQDIEIGLYRIAQEALNNITKHAQAREVEVQIVRHKNGLRLTIEDDGKGMNGASPVKEPSASGGTGLVSMRERASSFGGTVLVDSFPGKGTMINVEIPIKGA